MNSTSKKEESEIASENKVSVGNKSSISKDDEFKISLSIEDINEIEEEIKRIENNSKKSLEELSITKDEVKLMNTEKNQNLPKKIDHVASEYLENSWEDED